MIVECKKCGAPLDVQTGSAFAKCAYCGHSNKVKSARTLMAERPVNWAPPPVWTPPKAAKASSKRALSYQPDRPPAPPTKSYFGLFLGVIVLFMGGAAALYASGTLGEFGLTGIDESGQPTLGTVDLDAATNAPPLFDGQTSGFWSLDGLGSMCRGYVPREPQVLLRTSLGASVRLNVESRTDLVMAVLTADGQWICDDDSGNGTAPAISTMLGPGEHRVWVGTYHSDGDGAFTLDVSSQSVSGESPAQGLDVNGTPSLGVVHVGPEPTHGIWDGTTTPWVDASTLAPGCHGHIAIAPHVHIEATEARPIRIETAQSNTDLILVVRTPSGQFICDDDSGEGLNSRVELTPEIGRTAVWVGTYSPDGGANFSLEISDVGARRSGGPVIAPSEAPLLGHVNLDAEGWMPVHEGSTRAELDARTLAPDCRGWVGVAPDLVVLTTVPRAMAITTSSRSDLTLIVRGPDGSFVCDDDSGERNSPRVHQSWTGGAHQVWVGTISRRPAPYQLVVSETPLTGTSP